MKVDLKRIGGFYLVDQPEGVFLISVKSPAVMTTTSLEGTFVKTPDHILKAIDQMNSLLNEVPDKVPDNNFLTGGK